MLSSENGWDGIDRNQGFLQGVGLDTMSSLIGAESGH